MKQHFNKLLLLCLMALSFTAHKATAQTTETFESRTVGASTFTNGITFNLSPSASYKIATLSPAFNVGYLTSANYIDNPNANPTSITSTSNFTVKSLYLYPSTNGGSTNQTAGVSVTLTGKLGGGTQFTYTPPAADFAAAHYTNATNRGFSLVDFAIPGHQNTSIDELVIDIDGAGNYFAVDNFTFAASATTPTVTTPTHTNVSSYLAVMGGNVTAGSGITETGIVWSTSNMTPTIADKKVVASGIVSTGVFAIVVQNLPAASTVYYRAYATNGSGTSYSTASNFTTGAAKTINYTDGMNAEFVVGQPDFTTITSGTTSQKLNNVRGGSIDYKNGKLYIAEASNRRVLRFGYPLSGNNPVAELVFGQPDFTTNVNPATPTANTLSSPNACFVDNTGRLWVADRGDNRIVWYNNAHSIGTNQPNANGVLGQPDFITDVSAASATKTALPSDLVVDDAGTLWVVDSGNNRLIKFNKAANKANGAPADGVLGQTDFVTGTNSGVTANTLTAPLSLTMSGTTLWVADGQIFTRILRFDNAPAKANGAAADGVLGQTNFTNTTTGLTANTMSNSGARGVQIDFAGNLWVNDGGNDRTLRFNNAAAKANGAAADGVLGQTDFVSGTVTVGTQNNLNNPAGLVFDVVDNRILISQISFNRVSVFSSVIVATPTISSSGTPSAVTTIYGTASGSTSFNVSGANMTAGILVTPPSTNFEVSLTAGSGYGASVTVGAAGTIASTPVYIRLKATTNVGSYSGNIVLTSSGATNVNVAMPSSTVTAKSLTITGLTATGNNKVYDGTTTATVGGAANLSGVLAGDVANVTFNTGSVTRTYNNANVGINKTITVGGYSISGTAAGNYTLTQPTGITGDITAKGLTITGLTADNKIFDGNTTATLSGTPTLNVIETVDIGNVTVSGTATANFASSAVGNNIAVTVTGYTLSGTASGNYTVSQPTGLTANITAPAPTITNFTPTSGGVDAVVTITGTGFTGASLVKIGGVNARSFTVVNATTITAVVNDGFATGLVEVTQGTTVTLGTFTRTSCANTITGLSASSSVVNGFAGFDVTWNLGAGTYTAINVFYQPQTGAGSSFYTRKTFAGNATSGRLSTVNGAGITYNIYIQGVCTGNSDRVSTITAVSGAGNSCSIIDLAATPLTVTNTDITFTWNTVQNAYLYQPIYQECDINGLRVAGGGQTGTAYLTPNAHPSTQSWTVSQLKPNTYYRFAVRVHCLQGNSNLISPYSLFPFIQTGASGVTCLAPSPTLGAAGETNGYASRVIEWAAVPSASNGYGINFRESTQASGTSYHLGNVTSYTISGLKQGSTYFYSVYASCSNGQNPRSAEGSFVAGTGQANDCNAATPNTSVGVSTPPIGATLSWTTTPNGTQAGKLYGIIYSVVGSPNTTYVVFTDNVSQTLSQTAHQGIVANTNYNYQLQTYCDSRLQWVDNTGTFFVPLASGAEKNSLETITPQGLQALAGLVDLQVYPNPTNAEVTITSAVATSPADGSTLVILDMLGREVYKNNNFGGNLTLNTKAFASGTYLVKVNEGGKVMTKKLVVQ
jgi:hypothetical protein